jgi:hypothetical protein
MVVNGEQPVAAVDLVPGETYIATVAPNGIVSSVAPAKPARQRKAKADKPAKPAKPATKAETGNQAPKEGKGAYVRRRGS